MRYYGIIIYYYVLLLLFIIICDCSAEALVLDFTTNCESSGSAADDAEAAFSAQAKFQESCSAATPSVQPGQYHLPIDKKNTVPKNIKKYTLSLNFAPWTKWSNLRFEYELFLKFLWWLSL